MGLKVPTWLREFFSPVCDTRPRFSISAVGEGEEVLVSKPHFETLFNNSRKTLQGVRAKALESEKENPQSNVHKKGTDDISEVGVGTTSPELETRAEERRVDNSVASPEDGRESTVHGTSENLEREALIPAV